MREFGSLLLLAELKEIPANHVDSSLLFVTNVRSCSLHFFQSFVCLFVFLFFQWFSLTWFFSLVDNVLSNVSYFLGMNISNVDSLLLSNSTLVVAATVNNVSIWVGIFDLNGTLILGQIVSSSVPNVIHGVRSFK
jgi:hypothetical protein